MANLDTGAVASASVTPGVVEPGPAPYGGWHLALAPLLAMLADRAGAAVSTLREVCAQDRPIDPDGELSVQLPRAWSPDLPTADRRALEADALAGRYRAPWLVYLGRTEPPDPPDADRQLSRLCRLADQLCLDLVVEARHDLAGGLRWDVRYELPGADVPARPHGYASDLPTAVAGTSVADALSGLDQRSSTAPAHYVDPTAAGAPPGPADALSDVDQLERRVMRDCDGTSGGQAIWRDGHWWHTSLRPGGPTTLPTGPIETRTVTGYLRNWEPPAPFYLGQPIPYHDCPVCRDGGFRAGPLPCSGCGGVRRIHHGLVLTVTDLDQRVVHLNWRADDERCAGGSTLVGTQAGADPVFQVAEQLRVRRWSAVFGVRPEELTEIDGEHVIDRDLREGIVSVPPPHVEPVGRYLALASRGRSGARLLVRATPWPGPPLATLAGIALELGLAIEVTAQDHRANLGDPRRIQGVWWEVQVVSPDAPHERRSPLRESLPEAVAYCLRYLGPMLLGTVPADPDVPMRVSRPHRPPRVPSGLEASLRRLAGQHAGQPVTVRLAPDGVRTYGVTSWRPGLG